MKLIHNSKYSVF